MIEEQLVPGAAPSLAEQAEAELATLKVPTLSLINDSDTVHWRNWLMEVGVRYRPRNHDRRFEDYDMVLGAARAGLGIAMLRMPLAEPLIARGELVVVGNRSMVNRSRHFVCVDSQETRASVLELMSRLMAAP
jgi:DNA-binding transcriptional LysR family regulator